MQPSLSTAVQMLLFILSPNLKSLYLFPHFLKNIEIIVIIIFLFANRMKIYII